MVDKEKIKELESILPLIQSYLIYSKSKNLGIKYGPKDLTIEQVNGFGIIQLKLETLIKAKDGITRSAKNFI